MPGKRGVRPKREQAEVDDPKGFVNGFKKIPTYEDGEFLSHCFEVLRGARTEVVYVTIPDVLSNEELAYVKERIAVVHWRVTVRGNRMRIAHAPRNAKPAKPLELPLAASDYE